MTRILILCAVLSAVGCTGGGKVEDFTPSTTNARNALTTALTHWQGGGQPGTVPNTTAPIVEVTDSKWRAGQKITGFEITAEETPDKTGPVFFTVKLTSSSGPPVVAKYAVFGIDPLLIYRDEDYQKLSGTGK